MGESFSAESSTGIVTYSIPFNLPSARGAVQVSLGLSYSSGGGHGVAGAGWGIGAPSISRQMDRGVPHYVDPPSGVPWSPEQDRFVFGSAELVPICLVDGASCPGALAGEEMPAWASGWRYFRSRIEGGFNRFYWSPNRRTWRVQDKGGASMEFGVPLDASGDTSGLEGDPADEGKTFSWHLVRRYDANGNPNPSGGDAPAPNNPIVYRYRTIEGISYLSDIYDTTPAANPTSSSLAQYAHHTQIVYEARPDISTSYRRGWPVRFTQRVVGVDVTSHNFDGTSASRELVRRYHLRYAPDSHVSLLTEVSMEGRCEQPIGEDGSGHLPPTTGCPRLPGLTFTYQRVAPFQTNGGQGIADLAGYEGFDERVRTISSSPPHSLDEGLVDLFDINADGLPDVLATAPHLYNGKHAVFINGSSGSVDHFGAFESMGVQGVAGVDTNVLKLTNPNVSANDIDGDAIANLIHMPRARAYEIYSPVHDVSGWNWQGRVVPTANEQNPKVDFVGRSPDIRQMDVNADGLVDLVYSSATELQTFLSLGRYPGGDGQYGTGTWTGPSTATIMNEPITSCIPWSALPVRLSDPDVRVADMNGDGFPDIVRVRQGDIRYWPGRGDGFWGTGDASTCQAGTFGQDRHVAMAPSPFLGIGDDPILIADINGDALADVVKVKLNAVDIYLNVDGVGWTERHAILNTPTNSVVTNRVRLADVNGSGTPDILWGQGHAYKYIDLLGGRRPWILSKVANGLGRTTEFEYTTSAQEMLAAEVSGQPWESKVPMVVHMVSRIIDSDNLQVVGRPGGRYVSEYTYRNPVFNGRQREFRGFRNVRAKKVGDANSPTSIVESTFLLGECRDESAANSCGGSGVNSCAVGERWRDNPREALKGLPVLSEAFDEHGVYLSTAHTTYRLRHLYDGLDGREVRHAFGVRSDSYGYDSGGFTAATSTVPLDDVELERTPGCVQADESRGVTLRSTSGRAHIRASVVVDVFGNQTDQISNGCVDGCAESDETITRHSEVGRPQQDSSGWLWRTLASYTSGSNEPSSLRSHHLFYYNNAGYLTSSEAVLSGTLELDRFHSVEGRDIAPVPPNAAVDGTVFVKGTDYNEFGEPYYGYSRNGHCTSTYYDDVYRQLPIVQAVTVGQPAVYTCGSMDLETRAQYDRGLGVITKVIDQRGGVSTATYDYVGRLTAIYHPDPDAWTSYFENPSAGPGLVPSVKISYFQPENPGTTPYSRILVERQDGNAATTPSFHSSWSLIDGLGRTMLVLNQADPSAGDGGSFTADGLVDYDAKGASSRAYLSTFYSGDPGAFPFATIAAPSVRQRYDAFGRPTMSYALDGSPKLRHVYHALSEDIWDAGDLEPGPHHGTPVTKRKDGHGRAVSAVERVHQGSQVETHETKATYLPTGEPTVISRVRAGSNPVVRWFRYDSLGRLVLNVDPNTTKNFNPDPSTNPGAMKAWRYAYNVEGELVGTSDPRGCGINYHREPSGRLFGEDYSPCREGHADYSLPDPATGEGFEVSQRYDAEDPDVANISGFPSRSPYMMLGQLASSSDRGSKTVISYDGRTRPTHIARKITKPGGPNTIAADRYASHWYSQVVTYDGAGRPTAQSTGADVEGLLGENVSSLVVTAYTKRGSVKDIGSSYGALVSGVSRDADGLVQQITYGDLAHTSSHFQYDQRRRLSSVQTDRGPPGLWTETPPAYSPAPPDPQSGPSSFQLVLEDSGFEYDAAGNPATIRDWRDPDAWPVGAKPVTRKAQYDDLYRLTNIEYSYADGDNSWTSPYHHENTTISAVKPSPHVEFDQRIRSQSFRYDWLGNTIATSDDAHGFYDRSLGTISNGAAAAGPYQLQSANLSGSTRGGGLASTYDDAGNLSSLVLERAGPCLPAGAVCSQRFVYEWDEAGRLANARRWDLASPGAADDPIPAGTPDADLRYSYDGANQRVLKTAVDATGNQLHDVYIFASLELRRTTFADGDYERTTSTEAPYLVAAGVRLARLYYAANDVPTVSSGNLHVLFELPNYLGSSSFVIDGATSELVEATQYQAYGATESDYRPERWKGYREDYRFTGKEEDIEVGLTYFGERYLSPYLNRWISPDPLAVHAPGEGDLNLYAYVHGRALNAVDPIGLDKQQIEQDEHTTLTIERPDPPKGADASEDLGRDPVVDGLNRSDPSWRTAQDGWSVSSSYENGQETLHFRKNPLLVGGAQYIDFRGEARWSPYAQTSMQAMLLGSRRELSFSEASPELASQLRIVGMLTLSISPLGVLLDIDTLFNPNASLGQRLLAGASVAMAVLPPLRAGAKLAMAERTVAATFALAGEGGGGVFRFAHGTSAEFSASVTTKLDAEAAKAASKGGTGLEPGSFFAHEIGPPGAPGEGLQLAYEWGLRHTPNPHVVIGEIPRSLADELIKTGGLRELPLAGSGGVPQFVFDPKSFDVVNQHVKWIDVLKF
jgi:RHS repeat-associated protein